MYNYTLQVLSENYAREICNWRYEGDLSVYNFSDYETVEQNGWDLAIKEKREKEYVGILSEDELVAYGRITCEKNRTMIGIGLKPNLCGQGLGKSDMKVLMNEAKVIYPNTSIGLEVRTFNTRAIKCYLNLGFQIINQYQKETFSGKDEFFYMEYDGK